MDTYAICIFLYKNTRDLALLFEFCYGYGQGFILFFIVGAMTYWQKMLSIRLWPYLFVMPSVRFIQYAKYVIVSINSLS